MYYSGIEPCDALNGTGFRTVIWVSGCSIACKGCFNPSTHNQDYGQEYTQETEDYILKCLSKDYIDGITITGGNPLESYNIDVVLSLIKKIKSLYPTKTIWLYSGLVWEQIFNDGVYLTTNCDGWKRREIVKYTDVFVDGVYIESKRNVNLKWRGSSNQRVINTKKSLKQGKVILYCD